MTNTWAQKAEENIELFTNASKGAEAARMIDPLSPTNRIIADRDQAIILQIGRLMQSRFMNLKPPKVSPVALAPISPVDPKKDKVNKYQWVKDVLDNVESHQATIDAKTRSDFKEVAIAQGIGVLKRFKGELDNLASK